MKKRRHKITEHYLVPLVLVLLNVCLAHLIYAFVTGSTVSPGGKVSLVLAFALLGSSLWLKKQVHLAGSILFYTFVIFLS